jgi:hypothetical protein
VNFWFFLFLKPPIGLPRLKTNGYKASPFLLKGFLRFLSVAGKVPNRENRAFWLKTRKVTAIQFC